MQTVHKLKTFMEFVSINYMNRICIICTALLFCVCLNINNTYDECLAEAAPSTTIIIHFGHCLPLLLQSHLIRMIWCILLRFFWRTVKLLITQIGWQSDHFFKASPNQWFHFDKYLTGPPTEFTSMQNCDARDRLHSVCILITQNDKQKANTKLLMELHQ